MKEITTLKEHLTFYWPRELKSILAFTGMRNLKRTGKNQVSFMEERRNDEKINSRFIKKAAEHRNDWKMVVLGVTPELCKSRARVYCIY